MKVLILTAMFPPIRTGTSFYSRNLAAALSDRGCQTEVITVRNSELYDVHSHGQVKIHRIPALHLPLKNYFKHLRFCSFSPGNYKKVLSIARKHKPDAIILVNHYLDIAFLAIYASRKLNIPLHVSVGTQLQSLNPIKDSILRWLDRVIVGNLVFRHARRIISWDREIDRNIREVHNKANAAKSVIIPFGVNGDPDIFESYHNKYDNFNQILGVGAVIGHRDYMYQIRVFQMLLKKFPELKLKIIGNIYIDKPLKYARKLGIADKVVFTGELPHEQVLEEYQQSLLHWMMLNGEYVGLGTSTIEAMLMGVPVVSNVPQKLFEDVELIDMQTYIHTDGKSVIEDLDKISIVIQDSELRKRIGKNGRDFVKQNLNWGHVAAKYMALISTDTQSV